MFTGLISDVGRVVARDGGEDGARIEIRAPDTAAELAVGGSVAVNGVCLTATEVDGEAFAVEATRETLRASNVRFLERDERVNLELPLTPDGRLGGHFVQGHVDGVGEVVSKEKDGIAERVLIRAADEILGYLVDRGSVAVDGVSLTVTHLGDDEFGINLIPETLKRTSLGRLKPNTRVNIEVDVLAKYVARFLIGNNEGAQSK